MAKLPAGMRKKDNGTFESRFTIDGKRYSVYGKSVNECRAKEATRRQEIEANTYKPGKELSLAEYYEKWEEHHKSSVKASTTYSQHKRFYMAACVAIDKAGAQLGDVKLGKIEPTHLRTVQKALAETLAASTVNSCMGVLRMILQAATNERLITWNPAAALENLKITETPVVETIHRALTREETARFLKAARASWYYNFYEFLLTTGTRAGEAAALMPGDIEREEIHIKRTLTRTEDGSYTIGDDTKTAAGRREIPMNKRAADAIRDQRAINAAVFGPPASLDPTKRLIFRTPQGEIIRAYNTSRDIAIICKAAGLERFTAHAFRDTFATRCIEAGMQPKTLQVIMGHSNISITLNLYTHVMQETKREQLAAVSF